MLLFAVSFRAIGMTVFGLVLLVFVLGALRNIASARKELGSEVEVAPNRKPYYDDEILEGPKLDGALSFALVLLGILALALPFYWLAEPGRQEGAVDAYQLNFESRGADLYTVGAQCVNCHAAGGVGGGAAYVLQDGDGQFIANATWAAPALNNVLNRYSEEEVTYILNYGRPGSPMAAWGTPGGGPLTSQQVETIIDYLGTFQLQSIDVIDIAEAGGSEADDEESVAAQAAADVVISEVRTEVDRSLADGEFDTVGEAVFNLGFYSGYGAGAYSCGRCHTAAWSLGPDISPQAVEPGFAGCGGGDPSGIGYSLCGGNVLNRFPDDMWKKPDGSWPTPNDAYGVDYIQALDGTEIPLDDKGNPVDDSGVEFLIVDGGDLASCSFTSGLWEPGGVAANAYPFDQSAGLELYIEEDWADAEEPPAHTGDFLDPPVLTAADLDDPVELQDGRLADGCTVIEMPERTSSAHYDFVYNGADAGAGYGLGGQSHAGMMPGFGKILPPDYIQAVVDYERGL